MKPVTRGSLRPRASTSPSSRWNSCATRAGRSWVAIAVLLPPARVTQRARPLGEPRAVAEALDGEAAVEDLELPAVHRGDEVRHLVERLVHEGVVVPDGGHADDAPLPEVVVGDLGDRDVEL